MVNSQRASATHSAEETMTDEELYDIAKLEAGEFLPHDICTPHTILSTSAKWSALW